MGTVNATLLFAEPNTNWVNATFLRMGDLKVVKPSPAPGRLYPLFAARGESPASRGVLILTHPGEVGDDEVKQ
jgi:hypothetical protein